MKTIQSFDKILKIAAKGDLVAIRTLLKDDPTLLHKISEGHHRTLLWEAVNKNRQNVVEFLVDKGADVNIPGRHRHQTFVLLKPYCIAHLRNYPALKTYLVAHGHRMDIYTLAFLGLDEEVENYLRKTPGLIHQCQPEDTIWSVTPLHFAVAGNQLATLKLLLEAGAEVNKYSGLLYEIACRNNRLDIIKLLTAYGGDPKAAEVPAVFHHVNQDVIDFFIQRGLDCDKRYWMEWPSLAYLCRGDKGEHPKRIKALIKYVNAIDAQTPKGVTALHAAAKAGFLTVVTLLLEHQADINCRDHQGKTPLYYARKHKRKEVEAFLRAEGAVE